MDNNLGPSRSNKSPGKKPHRHETRSLSQSQEFIILPAIQSSENSTAKTISGTSAKITLRPTISGATSPKPASGAKEKKTDRAAPAEAKISEPDDFLPEYHSQTNGLRELLSTIDSSDIAYHSPTTAFETPLYETDMHIPHSAPGLPGSPDLPIGPTRWGLYISTALGGLAMLFITALVFSHVISPTGINWAKVQIKTGETYRAMVAGLSTDAGSKVLRTTVVRNDLAKLLDDIEDSNGTVIATASRISTTAASPQKGTLKTPTANEIFISSQELENQIKAFESATTRSRKLQPASGKKRQKTARLAGSRPTGFEQLVVIPAANIDPDMENQIFKRARSYLKQRDISSARMILQYAATLGSGISAMALAETFDPNYAGKIDLRGVSRSTIDARKWYYMAARLGINEAKDRLTALK